jgi:acetolactate synthase-1/2/3 large subunit
MRGRSGAVTRQILATPKSFAKALANIQLPTIAKDGRLAWFHDCHAAQVRFSRLPANEHLPQTAPNTAHMTALIRAIVERLPNDAVYSFGAGNHCIWAQRYLPTQVFPSQLSARNGAMGYGLPAGIVAALQAPERLSVVIAGDGEFLMNEAELSTAVAYGAPVLIVLMDNQQYGTIRLHQEQHYPGRISGTQLHNPDGALLAQSFGAYGAKITDDSQIEAAVAGAFKAIYEDKRPALLHVVTDQALALPDTMPA